MKEKSVLKNAEFFIGLFMLLFGGFLLWQINTIKIPESKILPFFSFFIITVSGVVYLFLVLIKKIPFTPVRDVLIKKKEWLMLAALLLTFPFFEILGFYTTLFFFLIFATGITFWPLNKRKVFKGLFYDIVLIVFTYICFTVFLGLVTPTGLFY